MPYALEFLTGMRTGEAAVRRWRDWEPRFKEELGRLVAATAYNTRFQVEKTTKTDVVLDLEPGVVGGGGFSRPSSSLNLGSQSRQRRTVPAPCCMPVRNSRA